MSNETFATSDSADDLNTFEDVAAYLEAVLEDSPDEPRPSPPRSARSPALATSARSPARPA